MGPRKPLKKCLATTVFAAGMLISSNAALAHETGPDASHEHSSEEEQDTPEHTDLCTEVLPTDGWEEFSSESSHIYSGAFDQYSDEMQAMMRVQGTYEECELLLEPIRRRNIQEWLVGDGEDGFWVSACEGDSNLPTAYYYSDFQGGVWLNGKPALNPELCQKVADLLNETPGDGLGNNGIWRARIAALVEDALSSRCTTDTENGYDLKTCRQSATSANTILNCLDSIVESLPEDKEEAQEMIHDQLFGIRTEEGWTPSDNSGLCRPSSVVQPVHSHEGQEPHFDDGHEEVEPESAQANSEDEAETNQVNSEENLETAQANSEENLETAQANSEDEAETNQVNSEENLETAQANSEENLETAQANSEDEAETNQVNSEENLETAQANSEEELETKQVNSEDEAETAQANSEEELETNQVNSEEDTNSQTAQQAYDETLAKLAEMEKIPDDLRIVFQGAIKAYHDRGCTTTIRENPRPRIIVDCS